MTREVAAIWPLPHYRHYARRMADRLSELALKCNRLARSTADKGTADELEGVAAELAQMAQKLNGLDNPIDDPS